MFVRAWVGGKSGIEVGTDKQDERRKQRGRELVYERKEKRERRRDKEVMQVERVQCVGDVCCYGVVV